MENQHVHTPKKFSDNRVLLAQVFQHKKCINLSESDKEKINRALAIAVWAHRNQKRKDGTPYMDHIRGTIGDYMKITKKDFLTAHDIIVMILHDVVEDHPRYIKKIQDAFDGTAIYKAICELSKDSGAIVQEKFSIITSALLSINTETSEPYFAEKLPDGSSQGPSHQACYNYICSLYNDMKDDLKNYHFLWKIYSLSEDQFERKTADRINNMNSLKFVNTEYIDKNIRSTSVYILKAKALGREDLARLLEEGMIRLKKKKDELSPSIGI